MRVSWRRFQVPPLHLLPQEIRDAVEQLPVAVDARLPPCPSLRQHRLDQQVFRIRKIARICLALPLVPPWDD
jgi:hypothetical protein